MKIFLTILISSLIVILLGLILNFASFNGKIAKNNEKLTKELKNNESQK